MSVTTAGAPRLARTRPSHHQTGRNDDRTSTSARGPMGLSSGRPMRTRSSTRCRRRQSLSAADNAITPSSMTACAGSPTRPLHRRSQSECPSFVPDRARSEAARPLACRSNPASCAQPARSLAERSVRRSLPPGRPVRTFPLTRAQGALIAALSTRPCGCRFRRDPRHSGSPPWSMG